MDDAAALLTKKLVEILNVHAPWIVFQQRKHYTPWLTEETKQLMQEWDMYKEKAKAMASVEVGEVSSEQEDMWNKYKKLRNNINNRISQEEIKYKKIIVNDSKDNPGLLWGLAKIFMSWTSPGPPTQLEVK